MSITADLIRGHTDTIILAALMAEDSYGYRISRMISRQTDGRFEMKEATLYTAFKRLEETGYISSYWGEEGSGARRRYYAITTEGREAYGRLMREWAEAELLIDKLIKIPAQSENYENGGNTTYES